MVAEAILRDVNPRACNCRQVLRRGDQRLVVKAGKWDCPSCGSDKKRALVDMTVEAFCRLLLTLTFEQPRAHRRGKSVVPQGYESCLRRTHVRSVTDRYGKTSLRWQTIPGCVHCCRRVSGMVHRFVKSVRRRWPEFEYLKVNEPHKSGATHLHWGVTGLPEDAQRTLQALWMAQQGGRQVDLRASSQAAPGGVGRYLGKYLAKRQDFRMAAGYRLWSRSRGFAPAVLMAWSTRWRQQHREAHPLPVDVVQVPVPDAVELRREGWAHPESDWLVSRVRWWAEAAPAPG